MSSKKLHLYPDIRLGFEIECIIFSDKYDDFQNSVIKTCPSSVQIGHDPSIESDHLYYKDINYEGVELRTYPREPVEAMETLKELFQIVELNGMTNYSCGLHLNISSISANQMCNLDEQKFLCNDLWKKLLASFRRSNNEYCQHFNYKKRKYFHEELLEQDITNHKKDKYHCVNLSHFNLENFNHRTRIEIRGFGNANYHKKYDLIEQYTLQIMDLFNECSKVVVPKYVTLNRQDYHDLLMA